MPRERWFIKDGKVRWIKTFINADIHWDNGKTHLVFSMDNSYNEPHRPNDGTVESVDTKDCFLTQKEAQMEIIRRERFEKK